MSDTNQQAQGSPAVLAGILIVAGAIAAMAASWQTVNDIGGNTGDWVGSQGVNLTAAGVGILIVQLANRR